MSKRHDRRRKPPEKPVLFTSEVAGTALSATIRVLADWLILLLDRGGLR